jgi:hypothetical protein
MTTLKPGGRRTLCSGSHVREGGLLPRLGLGKASGRLMMLSRVHAESKCHGKMLVWSPKSQGKRWARDLAGQLWACLGQYVNSVLSTACRLELDNTQGLQ